MVTSDELLEELEQEALTTRRVLERVPEDQLGWRPHDKAMTLGQLAMHVATLPGAIAELAMQGTFDIHIEIPRPSATSAAELVATLDQSVATARDLLGGMDEVMLASPSVLLNHWHHHRGQLTAYLRETGALVPAI